AMILNMPSSADPAKQASREIIERQVAHMARPIDDLLDVSRITCSRLNVRKERVALAAVIEQALETARPHLGQELGVSLPPEPVYLHADPVRLAQVFSNLLNNATKYTEKGSRISLTAEQCEGEARVRVRDTGAGI